MQANKVGGLPDGVLMQGGSSADDDQDENAQPLMDKQYGQPIQTNQLAAKAMEENAYQV